MSKHAPPAILIVEDEELVALGLRQTLIEIGYDAFAIAASSEAAIACASAKRPDLVLMDNRIKGLMDGIQTAALLEERFGSAVIYLTAHADEATVERAKKTEPYCYLLKPVRSEELRSMIEVALYRRDLDDARERTAQLESTLARQAAELSSTNSRLLALTDLNLQLASERDPRLLLEKVCDSARNLIGARFAVLVVTESTNSDAVFCATSGIEWPHSTPPSITSTPRSITPTPPSITPTPPSITPTPPSIIPTPPSIIPTLRAGPLGSVYAQGRVWRARCSELGASTDVFPAGYPAAQAYLAVPIGSLTHTYGWLCLADKLGANAFTVSDERVLGMLAGQVGRIYENSTLYQDVQLHAAQLQVEMDEREIADNRIRQLNRVYAVLTGINSLLVKANTQDELFTGACKLAVNHGGFPLAWIGVVDERRREISPIAVAGNAPYIEDAVLARKVLAFGQDPYIPAAVTRHLPQICDDLESTVGALFSAEMAKSGCRSMATLPLVHRGATVACLILATARRDAFDEAEIRLLSGLADDISYALDHIDKAARLMHAAYYDELTGLANRTLFLERLARSVSAAGHGVSQYLVVVAELERFDAIKDTFGGEKGDALLKEIADRLCLCIGDRSAVARVAPEHFAAIIPFSGAAEGIIAACEHTYQAWLDAPFTVGGSQMKVFATAGIALFPHDGFAAEALLKNAESALKRAKASGEKFVFCTTEISEKVAERLTLETQLRQALANHELDLHYQPKVDLDTRAIVGVEALMRWQNPVVGMVPPTKFIAIMEETGMIIEAGAWALRHASEDHAAWGELGLDAPRIAVNVSSVQVRRSDFVAVLTAGIAEIERPGRRPRVGGAGIDIEVTESLLLEHADSNVEKLKAIRRIGVNIGIDDFGTGYSSLSYLAKLPLDSLKIDRSFIAAMLDDPTIMTLVSTMITLAHSLKLQVIAEGVESEEQAKILRLLRCDQMQGYLISRPLPFAAMSKLLTRSTARPH